MSVTLTGSSPAVATDPTAALPRAGRCALGVVRILLGVVYLWPFVDKLFGLGLQTPSERAWLAGGSPTNGYLSNLEGPLAGVFGAMAGNPVADWLFMLGILGTGVAFLTGAGLWPAAAAGTVLMGSIWLTSLPLDTHPFLDQHLFFVVLGWALALIGAGRCLGVGSWWAGTGAVRRMPWLR
jgi:thiosulfate dehydrogenase [quinone] large subunit